MPNNNNYISSIIFNGQTVPIKQNLESPISIAGTNYTDVNTALEALASNRIQVTELPLASNNELGKIYQYIGTTNNNYIKGYFYECVYRNSAYSWQEINTQKDITDMDEIFILNGGSPS